MRNALLVIGAWWLAIAVPACTDSTVPESGAGTLPPADGGAGPNEPAAKQCAPLGQPSLGCVFCLTVTNIDVTWPSDPKSTRKDESYGEIELRWASDTQLESFNLGFFRPDGAGKDIDFVTATASGGKLTGTGERNKSFDVKVTDDVQHGYVQGLTSNAQTAPILSGEISATFTLDQISGKLSVKAINDVIATGTFSGRLKPVDRGCR